MESEHSCSEGSSASSNSSSISSGCDEEVMEHVRIMTHSLELPQELCEDYSLFKEFFSMKTWENLDEKHKEYLKKLLPEFPENDDKEKEKTIKMLFDLEPFHFTSPLVDFFNNLKQGNYRPDIAKMRKFLKKARRKQQRHKIKSYYAKLLPEVLISRERLLAAVKAAPPGPMPYIPSLPKRPSKNNYKSLYLRARQRYFDELAAIQSEVGVEESEDDNYPEGPPEQLLRKHKLTSGQVADSSVSGTLGGGDPSHPTSLECLKNVLASHRVRRQYRENHPELNTTGITLEDIKQRVALVNGAKKLMFGSQKSELPIQKLKKVTKKESLHKLSKTHKAALKKVKEEDLITDEKASLPDIKVKQESDSESSSFVNPITSPKKPKKYIDGTEVKKEVIDLKYMDRTNINFNESKLESVIKQEPLESTTSGHNTSKISQPVPIKLEDLDGIDMMALPVELADDEGELPIPTSEIKEERILDPDESLTETTYPNFISLVRALFPARSAHRASKQQLYSRCEAVMRSPIAPLNTWYSLSDDWCSELDSALDFLAGERGPHPDDFVPYLQYMPETHMYQWIGAGRDCDAILGRLCERWLRSTSPVGPPSTSDPLPPRYPTSWVVRPPSSSEIAEFRAQERRRFSSAAKPFTYIQHGYRAVVGPCARLSIASSGHSAVLSVDRPRHATLLALVRDAAARLPNGLGTRRDVLILLKMSQWIAPCSEQTLITAVTAALERLSSSKRDPVLKYDARTALWTYLHRNRSEEDWLKNLVGRGRAVKATAVAPSSKSKDLRSTPSPDMDFDVANVEEIIEDASDTDVDVDDSSLPSSDSQLSSAQLLMQATQAKQSQHTTQIIKKPKAKLIATPPQKPKTNQTGQVKPNLMTQSAKLANLIAQSTKQANVAQSSKQNVSPVTKQGNLMTKQSNVQSVKAINSAVREGNIVQTSQTDSTQLKQNIAKLSNASQPQVTTVPVRAFKQNVVQTVKPNISQGVKQNVTPTIKQSMVQPVTQTFVKHNTPVQPVKQSSTQSVAQVPKSSPSVIATPHKSPLFKQRPLQKTEMATVSTPASLQSQQSGIVNQSSIVQPSVSMSHNLNKVQGTRSLLIRPAAVQSSTTTTISTPTTQAVSNARRGVVRVLSPATPSSGKSLISPQALMQQDPPSTKKRNSISNSAVTTTAQISSNATVVSSIPTVVSSSVTTRTVQLGGRTVQLATNQTVHLPGGQAVQITPGHTLQLSSLQLPTHSVRLPSGQTVQLASPQTVRAVSTTPVRNQPSPTIKSNVQAGQSLPVSSVQLAGQTVQIAGQTVQLAGQSVQLTGHTVKLPSGQSVQVASQSVMPSQNVQTIQLPTGNLQTVQLGGQSVQLSGQSVQLGSQTVQIGGQTVQLAGGQTVQLPSGQRLQLASGQTVQLSSGQTLQLASGQTVQLANQQATKSVAQVIRTQTPSEKPSQPIVAKLLTNAQSGMISLEGLVGNRSLQAQGIQVAGVRPRANVRLLSPGTRLARPLLLTSKPLHNIILQQSDGSAIRVTSAGGTVPTQAIVLSNIGAQTVTTSTITTPVLKLQQAGTSGAVTTSSGVTAVRSVLMDGQQLKLVGGRHVLARLLRPAQPPQ